MQLGPEWQAKAFGWTRPGTKTYILEEGAHYGVGISNALNETVLSRLINALLEGSIDFQGDNVQGFSQTLQTLRKGQVVELVRPFQHLAVDERDDLSGIQKAVVQRFIKALTGRDTGEVGEHNFDLRTHVRLQLLERALQVHGAEARIYAGKPEKTT